MNPVSAAEVGLAVLSVIVHVDEGADKTRVRLFGIPVYDSTWSGVKRRQARRAARRAARADEGADTTPERPSAKRP